MNYVWAGLAGMIGGPVLALVVLGRFFGDSSYEDVGIPTVLISALAGTLAAMLLYWWRRRQRSPR